MFLSGCFDDKQVPPKFSLTTKIPFEITKTGAVSGGIIENDFNAEVIDCGVVWGIENPFPSLERNDGFTSDATISRGKFVSEISDVHAGKIFNVRSYATFSFGTIYGETVNFTTKSEPFVSIINISNISYTEAYIEAIVIEGTEAVKGKGLVWNTQGNPTFENNEGIIESSPNGGLFSSNIGSLQHSSTYYIRAFASTSAGKIYSSNVEFYTEPFNIPGSIITDIDGNQYRTAIIGNLEWMAENLRATHYAYGTPIESGIWDYNDNPANSENYGKLYSWETAMNGEASSNENPSGIQGVCPSGWHLPSDSQWEQMINYLINTYGVPRYNAIDGAGNRLKAARQVGHPWGGKYNTEEHPRWNQNNKHYGTDDFGFSGLPGGHRCSNGNYWGMGWDLYWWSSTEHPTDYELAARWRMHNNNGSIFHNYSYKNGGFSVRCVRNVN